MQNSKFIRAVHSFVVLPLIATSLPFHSITQIETTNDISNVQMHEVAPTLAETSLEDIRKERADKIDAYFKEKNMPMAGLGMKMVIESEKNDIDWRLLPAIAVRESTGGRHACKKVSYSPFGWGSCKISFKSYDHAIEVVAHNLGGNNPKTARYYDGKTLEQIINAYNPPSIIPKYHKQVVAIMETIEKMDVGTEDIQTQKV